MMLSKQPGRRGPSPAPAKERCRATAEDFASAFEEPITILEDLMLIAIEEIGNGSGRALSVLLPAIRYVHDLKALNRRLLDTERAK
jgi:hypothetical protein